MTAFVAPAQRFTGHRLCPVCGGHAFLPHGQGRRCWGFLSEDSGYAHCTRPEWAGLLEADPAGAFAHRLADDCRCGRSHADHAPAAPMAAKAAKAESDVVALRIWEAGRAAAGSIVARYLVSRGLVGPIPASLRYVPRLAHAPSGQQLPAMVAAVTRWPGLRPVAVHRTYLRPDGAGKAAVDPCRMALGPVRGGAVRLAEPGPVLAVAEGIETALSLQQQAGLPAWAALSAGNLAAVALPPLPVASEVIIGADPDPAGLRGAHAAAARWQAEGRRVRIAVPPAGSDFNDLLWRPAT